MQVPMRLFPYLIHKSIKHLPLPPLPFILFTLLYLSFRIKVYHPGYCNTNLDCQSLIERSLAWLK